MVDGCDRRALFDRAFRCTPRGLRRPEAAAYIGISPSKFDDWVLRGLMPTPKRQDGVVVWDRFALDLAFDVLPDSRDNQPDDQWKDLKA
jgi:hypothetical protein